MAERVQRKRAKGFKLPPNTVCVTRGTKWGNPFRVENGITRDIAIALFRQSLTPEKEAEIRRELKGKNLACFCALSSRCHGDVLLEIAASCDHGKGPTEYCQPCGRIHSA